MLRKEEDERERKRQNKRIATYKEACENGMSK
jgi:hypothetical protein